MEIYFPSTDILAVLVLNYYFSLFSMPTCSLGHGPINTLGGRLTHAARVLAGELSNQ